MTDESDEETLDDRLESIQRRAENFRELLEDGDEVTIGRSGEVLQVVESFRSKFERQHAKLFGRMLSIEEQMKTGLFPYFLGLVGFAGFLVGLQLTWWEDVLGASLCEMLNRWWFYVLAPPSVLYLAHLSCGRWGYFKYLRHRVALLDMIAAAGLDRDELLVMLRDESELNNVVHFLKLDPGPFLAAKS